MRKTYPIKFTKAHKPFKKGEVYNDFSRDISKIFVNDLKVAQYTTESKEK